MTVDAPTVQRVGRLALSVEPAAPSPENQGKWSRRAESLAGWLLAEWRRERREGG